MNNVPDDHQMSTKTFLLLENTAHLPNIQKLKNLQNVQPLEPQNFTIKQQILCYSDIENILQLANYIINSS
jgi:hypothetical protein